MKQLFEHVKHSVYGPAYYRELSTHPLSFSWKYYSALALSVALFLTIVSSIPLVPRMNQFLNELPGKFFAYYPDQLEIKVDKGIVSSNVAEPYFLPLPAILKASAPPNTGESLVVIDTKTPFSLTQFQSYNADFWIGSNQVAFIDNQGAVRVEPLNTQSNFTVNEGVLRGIEQRLHPFYSLVIPVIVLAIFLGLLLAFGLNFAYLIFGAVLIFFLGRLLKQPWSYGVAYRIGLHAITLPFLISVVSVFLNLPFLSVPFLYSAVMLAVVYVNFQKAPLVVEQPIA